jgi:hypothetical protein
VGLPIAAGRPSVSPASSAIPELKATSDQVTPKAAVELILQNAGRSWTARELRELRARREVLGEGAIGIGCTPQAAEK